MAWSILPLCAPSELPRRTRLPHRQVVVARGSPPTGSLLRSASPRNARTHSAAQVAEIAGSIRAFGFTNPILAGEDGDVIAGHGRLAAARSIGLAEVPVIPLSGLTEVQRRQLVLADNRIALNAGWDLEMLNLELKELSVMGADLAALGFTAQELAAALNPGGAGLTDENEIPAVAETAVTIAGDIWCLSPHRVACGDSTDAETVKALLGGVAPALMRSRQRDSTGRKKAFRHRLPRQRPGNTELETPPCAAADQNRPDSKC
jgi:ParB-like chromosome segregation protein Spo0J